MGVVKSPRVGSLTLLSVLLAGTILPLNAITQLDFYQSYGKGDILRQGDSEFEMVKLEPPMPFFSSTFDHIYINTNGLLTFSGEYRNFVNFPFPLEYPAIAPFYANIDTTRTPDYEGGTISYFQSQDPEDLERGSQLVRERFEDANDFSAQSVFVCTWNNVGYFDQKSDLLNSFQVVLIWNGEEAYSQFLYPQGGINWVQAETGDSGLSDVRAQAGFVSEDGRFYQLRGSGTENVRFLTDYSNIGVPGKWLYRVGPLGYEENIVEPESVAHHQESEQTCATNGRMKCHVRSTCTDEPEGFCCACREGYYGNGYNCLKNDVPLRVTGSAKGEVNGLELSAQFQSYVILVDGRSYSALSPLPSEIGHMFQLLPNLGESVGWLFAKTADGRQNGYQLTGGVFNQTTVIRFATGESLRINYEFKGLNVWDQLTVDLDIIGLLPDLPTNVKVRVPDALNTYTLQAADNILTMTNERSLEVPDQQRTYTYTTTQEIRFESCPYKALELVNNNVMERIFKASVSYEPRDHALRVNMLNKVGDFDGGVNPCNEGAVCGENSLCVPTSSSETGYDCQCKNGYTLGGVQSGISYCVDINECASQSDNICDVNAQCVNVAGGYACVCHSGFTGNGYECTAQEESLTTSMPQENEECPEGDDRCNYVPSEEPPPPEPICDTEGCTCPGGYRATEYGYSVKCERHDAVVGDHVNSHGKGKYETCDYKVDCHYNANCEWSEEEQSYMCSCLPGYDGDGYTCEEKPIGCYDDSSCDVHATCQYDQKASSRVCVCEQGYVGDGRSCQTAPECQTDADCGINSWCETGLCSCKGGFERDLSDFCVPAGSCGGAFCAENAICQFDTIQQVSYCLCPKDFVGDGVHSCKSVPPPCNVRNNCGLNAVCGPSHKSHGEFECQCNPGYYGDGLLCTLQVNCANTPSICDGDATCGSSINGPICTCNSGFRGNGTVCSRLPRYDDGFLLISQGIAVVRVPFDAGIRGQPTTMSQLAISISKDCTMGRVYWSDIATTCIYSANYDGTDRKIFTCDDINSPEGLAVDWISRRLYWTDSSKDIIEVASLDNPRQRAVLISKGLVNPRGIAVDPHANKIYWSDWNRDSPKIESANLDGTDREILLSGPAVQLPNSLDINPGTGEICFADAGTGIVGCYDIYTRSVRTVVGNLSYPFGLAISSENFYWTDWTTRKIEVADRNGVRKQALAGPLFGNHKMYGMTAITDSCTHYHSLCLNDNGGCPEDRLCILNQRAPSGRSCLCATASCLV